MSNATQTAPVERVLGLSGTSMSIETAQWLLSLRADDQLQSRIDDLADKCNEGMLSREEHDEYTFYVMAAEVIALMQAEARIVLAHSKRA